MTFFLKRIIHLFTLRQVCSPRICCSEGVEGGGEGVSVSVREGGRV